MIEYLSKVTANIAMAALASFDVSGAATEDEDKVPMVRDKDFIIIAEVSRELELRGGRKWELQGLLSLLQLSWSMAMAGLRTGAIGVPHAVSQLEEVICH